jgi:hypothetical protein
MKPTTPLLLLSTLLYTSLAAPITITNVVEKRATTGNADKVVGPGTWIPLGNYKDAIEKRATTGTADKEVGPGAWIPAGNYVDAIEKRAAEAEAHEGAIAPATMSYATIAYAGAEEK